MVESGPWSPLQIDLSRQITRLRDLHPKLSLPSPLLPATTSGKTDILNALSRLLAFPALTNDVATLFRPLLMDLCSRWLDMPDLDENRIFEAFAYLIRTHRHIFPIMNAFFARPSQRDGPLAFIASSVIAEIPARPLHRLLVAYHRLLTVDSLFPQESGWSANPLALLANTPHPDPGVRILAILCYSLQSGMAEVVRENLYMESLGVPGEIDAPIEIGEKIESESGTVVPVDSDAWIIGVVEETRRVAQQTALYEQQDFFPDHVERKGAQLESSDLSPHIVNVSGILLFREDATTLPITSSLVETTSMVNAMRELALLVSDNIPALVSSPPGAGKSLLISHLASLLYPSTSTQTSSHVVSLHLSDTSIDPKSLVGQYVPASSNSSSAPGTFEWQEGPLCVALRTGKWLVLEDIDKASPEILGTILPLAESLVVGLRTPGQTASLRVPARGITIRAAKGFALFATRSVLVPGPANFLGSHHWHETRLPSPHASEQFAILRSLFPRIAHDILKRLVLVYETVRRSRESQLHAVAGQGGKSREVGLRDLIKWTRRIEGYFPSQAVSHAVDVSMDLDDDEGLQQDPFANPALKELVFLDAMDIFAGATPLSSPTKSVTTTNTANILADGLSFSHEQMEWTLHNRTPSLDVERSSSDGRVLSLRVGRSALHARSSVLNSLFFSSSALAPRVFALHRPALVLLEKLAAATVHAEPLLLVGETGTGKTTAIQHLASLLSHPLTALNLSHQTEVADLIGGFKPVDARVPAAQLQERFVTLFSGTFNSRRNAEYETAVRSAVQGTKWRRTVALWRDAKKKAVARIREISGDNLDSTEPRKRRKVDPSTDPLVPTASEAEWQEFERDVNTFEAQHVLAKAKFAFAFIEGPLLRALREGHWVLLDEINLASPETLEAIAPLLQSPTASLTVTEQGSLEPVPRHPSFRLFASMNPATDVGKKDLPPVFRSSFTELWVPPPDTVREALLAIVQQYIGHLSLSDRSIILDVAEFYEAIRKLSDTRQISDGSNQRPHFSMRTLTRALTFAADVAPTFSLRRAVWEGCLMTFTMTLDARSSELVRPLAEKHLLAGVKNKGAFLTQMPSALSQDLDKFVSLGPFRIRRGPIPVQPVEDYILTPSVQGKLIDLSRIILTRRFPVLIEGPTSAGKTSSIEYLARRTGHKFVRINNHEHTDIQEYIGTYVSDPNTGKLLFRDGILVRALRQGHWLVLDELNLAPTDVLEALNRLLDDNRELLIPETGEVVTPHPDFMLFATQNPPGLYAGRKVLSRAFRNRFLEVHFADVPQAELETILCQRCLIAPSYAQRVVAVFRELQKLRQAGRVFESKHGFATLRDLFRWAGRAAIGYQQLAEDGYMLLAERTRQPEDKAVVKEAIERVMKVQINVNTLYDLTGGEGSPAARLNLPFPQPPELVWTRAFQRAFILVASALKRHEPVLLVGETGTGKTSVCQFLAEVLKRELHILNCHQNTETADLLGGQRPIRNRAAMKAEACALAANALASCSLPVPDTTAGDLDAHMVAVEKALATKESAPQQVESLKQCRRALRQAQALFEWHDGPLVRAMMHGEIFLLDEISLADDSVLERLNSVLEPSRSIVLAEKGGWAGQDTVIIANDDFELVSTMNPGGDYGKKELSPALRNRFTEIWIPQIDDREDRQRIVDSMWQHDALRHLSAPLLDFAERMGHETGNANAFGLRDILAWVAFSNKAYEMYQDQLSIAAIFHHAARMTILDGLAALPYFSALGGDSLERLELRFIEDLRGSVPLSEIDVRTLQPVLPERRELFLSVGPFKIALGDIKAGDHDFSLDAQTVRQNVFRVVRACQLRKPILLEGSPGVGKTSLVTALAAITGHKLCRVNLSDQSDIMDLFGSDLPVDGGLPGEFEWRDAAFLRALQEGHWVLLDEMNLAPQAVLEGLNAVLDHRGTVFIPELGRTYIRHPQFRVFAAQNPLQQGGGRKGLPKSFLNRFTKVHIKELNSEDLLRICSRNSTHIAPDVLERMISFNRQVNDDVSIRQLFGVQGAPWEFNLRDVLRWIQLSSAPSPSGLVFNPAEHVDTIYVRRFRSAKDRSSISTGFRKAFPNSIMGSQVVPRPALTVNRLQIGHSALYSHRRGPRRSRQLLLQGQLAPLQAASTCIQEGWMLILTGPRGSGKTSIAQLLADRANALLEIFPMNAAIDTTDLIGNFEQADLSRSRVSLAQEIVTHWDQAISNGISVVPSEVYTAISQIRAVAEGKATYALTMDEFFNRTQLLAKFLESSEIQDILDYNRRAYASSDGRFEWVNGPLVQAMKDGRWILLDNVNLCNPAVLDRLNSLSETHGSLTLSERGLVHGEIQVLHPHPQFRLLMTVDPRHGELSRAMRNRGVELYLDSSLSTEDHARLLSSCLIHMPSYMDVPGNTCPGCPSYLELCRGIPRNIDFRHMLRINYGDLSRGDSVSNTIGLIADTNTALHLESSMVPMNEGHFAEHISQSLSPLEWKRAIKALPDVLVRGGGQNWAMTVASILTGLTKNVHPFREMHMSAPVGYRLPDEHRSIDVQLNPHYLGSPISLARYDHWTFELALRVFRTPLELSAPLNTPLYHSLALAAGHAQHGSLHMAIRWLAPIVLAGRSTARRVLSKIADTTTPQSEARIASLIGEYNDYLQELGSVAPFNLTALRAFSSWYFALLTPSGEVFEDLRQLLGSIVADTELTRGHRMIDIWKSFLPIRLDEAIGSIASSIEEITERLPTTQYTQAMRSSSLDFISMLYTKRLDGHEYLDAIELGNNLLKKVKSAAADEATVATCESAQILGQLDLLAKCWPIQDRIKKSQLLLSQGLQSGARLSTMVPLRVLAWHQEAATPSGEILAPSMLLNLEWHKALWAWNVFRYNDGPSNLLRSTLLHETTMASQNTSITLGTLDGQEAYLLRQQASAMVEAEKLPRDRASLMTSLLLENISILVLALGPTVHSDIRSSIAQHTESYHQGDTGALGAFESCLRSFKESDVSKTFARRLGPILAQPVIGPAQDKVWAWLGRAWVAFGVSVAELYLPEAALDPLVVQDTERDFAARRSLQIMSRIQILRRVESIVTGIDTNRNIALLEAELATLATPNTRPLHRASDPIQVDSLFQEIARFSQRILPRVLKLVECTEPNTDWSGETVLQGSLEGFIQRLQVTYNGLRDITVPAIWALYSIRTGLRMATEASRQCSDATLAQDVKLVTALTRFPTVAAISLYDRSPSSQASTDRILHRLAGFVYERSTGINTSPHAELLEPMYTALTNLWLRDREREAREREEATSLYRSHNHSVEATNDDEAEETEFRSLFPDYSDETVMLPTTTTSKRFPENVSSEQMRDTLHLHLQLLGSQVENGPVTRRSYFERRRSAVAQWFTMASSNPLVSALDADTLVWRNSLLRDRLFDIRVTSNRSHTPDFYNEANVPETQKSLAVLRNLRLKLSSIAEEWPDQMVLHHLIEQVDKILALPMGSPIAKVLAALERLLLQTDDWEQFANRNNTLKAQQGALISLIVDWRRLELRCWRQILDKEAASFKDGVSEWFFRLYELLFLGTMSVVHMENANQAAVTNHLHSCVPLIDEYMKTSPIGQFATRLELLKSFAVLGDDLSIRHENYRSALRQMSNIVHSQVFHYTPQLAVNALELKQRGDVIQKNILEYIELASWKDVNVYALKQSAERTHRHLHRCIRKFRDLLREPIKFSPSPSNENTVRMSIDPAKLSPQSHLPIQPHTPINTPLHLRNLQSTLERFNLVLQSQVNNKFEGTPSAALEELSSDVIETLQSLSTTVIVGDKEQRQKLSKALLVRKKRALLDLSKELKRLGVSQNLKPEVLALQQSRARLFEIALPVSAMDPNLQKLLLGGDAYFHRLVDGLEKARESMPSHHADISTRDIQRLLLLVESIFSHGIKIRSRLSLCLSQYDYLLQTCARLQCISGTSETQIYKVGPSVALQVKIVTGNLSKLVDALEELVAEGMVLREDQKADSIRMNGALKIAEEHLEKCQRLNARLSILRAATFDEKAAFLLKGEYADITDAISHIQGTHEVLIEIEIESSLRPMCRAISSWLPEIPDLSLSPNIVVSDHAPPSTIIDTLLIIAQGLPPLTDDSEAKNNDGLFSTTLSNLMAVFSSLKTSVIQACVQKFLQERFSAPGLTPKRYSNLQDDIKQILPFLEIYLQFTRAAILEGTAWVRSVFKLAHILCGITQSLAVQGFCIPQEDAEASSSAGGQGEAVEGSGLGTGSGEQNVSKEIEDESQVEGLQGEEDKPAPTNDGDNSDDDDAIEMSQDFEADLEDVPESGSGDSDEEGADDSRSDLDENINNLDSHDPNVVDEKLWSDEKGPQRDDGRQDDQAHSNANPSKDKTELSAKQEQEHLDTSPNSDDQSINSEDDEGPESPVDDGDTAPNLPEDSKPAEGGKKLDDTVNEADTLDLPDDMQMELDEETGEAPPESEEEASVDDTSEHGDQGDTIDQNASQSEDVPPGSDAFPQDGNEVDGEPESQAEAPTQAQDTTPDEAQFDDVSRPTDADPQSNVSDSRQPGTQKGDPTNDDGKGGQKGSDADATNSSEELAETKEDTSHNDISFHKDAAQDVNQTGDAQPASTGQAPTEVEPNQSLNPLRSLGDVLKNIRRRFEDISERAEVTDDHAPPKSNAQEPDNHPIEYATPDDVDEEMQALGPSDARDHVSKLRDLRIDTSDVPPTSLDDSEMQEAESLYSVPPVSLDFPESMDTLTRDESDDDLEHPTDGINGGNAPELDQTVLPDHNLDGKPESPENVSEEAVIEDELRRWQIAGQPDDQAHDLWRRYSSLTHNLANDLCEQLRLILEPTQATRLKGDFRTGKRLNMKKIIPYIASEFTKDKIWLRRTRPSKREYQVLIALDDSKSMREGRAAHLAFETLSLVVKALGRLEAGDTAVARFGETIDILHDFDSSNGAVGFGDLDGAKVIQSFKFEQRATNVLSLLERSLTLMSDARNLKLGGSSAAAELWQLEIIISDGICQDHEKLRALLRRATEQRIMVVFVIVDALRSSVQRPTASGNASTVSNSIVSMNQATYEMVNGKMELQMQRYLDSFPFEYYVVLRDVETLPDVLAGTLKQFFERISEE